MAKKRTALKVVEGRGEPELLDETSLEFLRNAHQSLAAAREAHARAEAHCAALEKQIMARAQLGDRDGLDLETGIITRKTPRG